ncbi:MAG: asparagine--tRNA ligase [Kiritimatiellaeota bacterium]|nr:asparagine--tRNA ligase [Kiritimatiellota bacterium]
MKRELIKEVLSIGEIGGTAKVAGWVKTRRDSKGGFSFIELNDGSCFKNLQIVADSSLENYDDEIRNLFPGASIAVSGEIVESPGGGQRVELRASEVKVFGFCDPMKYPLGKQRVSFEKLREIAHLRPRANSFGAVARVRNILANATHEFFQTRGFIWAHTPLITASDCEGAGEMFQVTTLPLENLPLDENGRVDYDSDFFARRAHLTVSGQLNGEAYACALGNIYTFGPTFRAENSNTRRHLAEFWMIEPEMAFADLNEDAELAADFLRHLFKTVLDKGTEDLEFFNVRIEEGVIDKLAKLADAEFARITYSEAVKTLSKADANFDFPVEWGIDLQSEHERYLTETVFKGPVIVTNYPASIKPFYMRLDDGGETVAAMDVLLPNVGEIIGGSQREERLDVLDARIAETGVRPGDYWWYRELREFGTVPHAGFGLGFERIVQFCTGMSNIRDVIPFPRTPRNADF